MNTASHQSTSTSYLNQTPRSRLHCRPVQHYVHFIIVPRTGLLPFRKQVLKPSLRITFGRTAVEYESRSQRAPMLPLRLERRSRARLPFRIAECDQNSVRYPSLLLLLLCHRLQVPSSSGPFPTSYPLAILHRSIFVTCYNCFPSLCFPHHAAYIT